MGELKCSLNRTQSGCENRNCSKREFDVCSAIQELKVGADAAYGKNKRYILMKRGIEMKYFRLLIKVTDCSLNFFL